MSVCGRSRDTTVEPRLWGLEYCVRFSSLSSADLESKQELTGIEFKMRIYSNARKAADVLFDHPPRCSLSLFPLSAEGQKRKKKSE